MRQFNHFTTLFLISILFSVSTYSKDSEDLSDEDQSESSVKDLSEHESTPENLDLITEKILKISNSKKIFLISNSNQKIDPGDYITVIKNNQPIARALTVKSQESLNAIKIIKIYSLKSWGKLSSNSEIQILRGDDSSFIAKLGEKTKKNPEDEDTAEDPKTNAVLNDEDLFSTTGLDENSLDEKGGRSIKPDNIIGASYGQYTTVDADGSQGKFGQFGAHWAYQPSDNFWGELYYGQTLMKAFPNEDLETTLTSITIRAKYTIAAPFVSFFQPYAGFQVVKAKSPNAGLQKEDNSVDQGTLNKETELIDEAEKNTVIFGITILKRLVPGWFIKGDVGTDIINLGFAIEF